MSKSSNSSRHSSPRAMPVETIITRFKSAQQKRQLREMDRSMTKVTELLKNPLKPKIKKKEPLKKQKSLSSIIMLKEDNEEGKGIKKKRKIEKAMEDELCPMKLKRHVVLEKVQLKPKHQLKIIAKTNKRKRSVPKKGLFSEDNPESESSRDTDTANVSPKAKRSKPLQGMSMDEMIQLIEDSGSLNDEDLLEILTCPSPVWWEDPPDGYIEDALFTRPRSTAEMYPSIRLQLQEDLQQRQRSSTPNILSRRGRVNGKSVSHKPEVKKVRQEEEELSHSTNDIDLELILSKCDEKFIKKRSKLERVLWNLKNKTIVCNKTAKTVDMVDDKQHSDSLSNKVSVIKNLSSKEIVKCDGQFEISPSSDQVKDKEKRASVVTDSEETDDEHLMDISFQDDVYLNDLENIDIPMQGNTAASPKKEKKETKSESVILLQDLKKDAEDIPKEHTDNEYKKKDCIISNCSLNKYEAVSFKNKSIDPTYSDKESSVIEDYLEVKLFEEDDADVKKKQNEYSKSEFKSARSLKCKNDSKRKEKNLKTSVIKFKNSDNTSINVFKIEGVVPKNLPPLQNSDRRKVDVGCMPENLPTLTRNPGGGCVPENLPPLTRNSGVIHINSESPKSSKSTKSFNTSESSVNQDNMDSISDTNICFLNEDDDDFSEDKKIDKNCELKKTASTVIKSSNDFQKNERFDGSKTKCSDNIFPTNEIQLTQDNDLYRNLTQINSVIANDFKDLEVHSLTITKVNDNSCCKVENKSDAVVMQKDDIRRINCEKEQFGRTGLTTIESNNSNQNEFNPVLIHNEIGKIGNENSECITVYKIVSDDSGNEEPKNDVSNTKNPKNKSKNLLDPDQPTEKSDGNRDKMMFYFKKCKNLYWKLKNQDNHEDIKPTIDKKELVNQTDDTEETIHKDGIDDVKNITLTNTGCLELNKETKLADNNEKETSDDVNHNNNLSADTKEQKSIIVSNTKQIRYCMKCSSIFDTAQCNYCYRKHSTENKNNIDNKNQCATDYLLKLEQCFVCDICRYKALSKDSLERHIMSGCCDSKHR